MADYRIEHDSMGKVKVPKDALWGAQTQRSLENFRIGNELMPIEIIYSLLLLKKACANVNFMSRDNDNLLEYKKGKAICDSVDYIIENDLILESFPLSVWQTGSGTQTNMNVNEVISNVAKKVFDVEVHPNDDVNKSQSTNDVFPSALHLATILNCNNFLFPAIDDLIDVFKELEEKYKDVIKSGRTHLQDATPIMFADEISAWRESLFIDLDNLCSLVDQLYTLPIGGTAVGTGINAKENFDVDVIDSLSQLLGEEFFAAENKFQSMSSKNLLAFVHSGIKVLACDLIKIANDIRFLSCGPRTGIGEISIPANEPGSSIMPGKVNPTQCEALIMACMQVQGNDVTVSNAASAGMLELNVCMPVIGYNVIQSANILGNAICCFTEKCVKGIKVNENIMKENLDKSLMNATILSPSIGYDNVAKVVKKAHEEHITIKQSCVDLGFLTEEEFDKVYNLRDMV